MKMVIDNNSKTFEEIKNIKNDINILKEEQFLLIQKQEEFDTRLLCLESKTNENDHKIDFVEKITSNLEEKTKNMENMIKNAEDKYWYKFSKNMVYIFISSMFLLYILFLLF